MMLVTNRTNGSLSVGSKIIAPNSSVTFTDEEMLSPNFASDLATLQASGAVTSTTTSTSVASYGGAGTYILPAGTTVAYVDPGGGVATVVLPAVAGAGTGSSCLVVQTGNGTVPILAAGTDKLFAGSATYTLAARGSALSLSSSLSTASWRMVGRIGAPLLFETWVNFSTGSDDNVGSLASPLLTLDEAVRRASSTQWLTTGIANVAAGTFSSALVITIPGGSGPAAQPFEIIGEVTLNASTGVVASATAGNTTGALPMTVTVVTPVTASQHVGALMRFTSGTLNGTAFGVYDNSTTVYTTFKFTAGVPTAADTFSLDVNATTLSGNVVFRSGTGSQLNLTRLSLTGASHVAQDCFLQYDRVHRVGFNTFAQNVTISTRLNEYGVIFSSSAPGSFSGLLDLDTASLSNSGFRGVGVQAFRGAASLFQCCASYLSRFAVTSSMSINRLYAPSATVSGGTNFIDVLGGNCEITAANINGVVGGAAISASRGANVILNSAVGTGNAGSAVVATSGGKIQVVGPTSTVTITGVSDCKVGANAATTWTLINGGLTANCTDVGAASSQLCRIGV